MKKRKVFDVLPEGEQILFDKRVIVRIWQKPGRLEIHKNGKGIYVFKEIVEGERAYEFLGLKKDPIIVCNIRNGGFLRYLEKLPEKKRQEGVSLEHFQNVITSVTKDITNRALKSYLTFLEKNFRIKKTGLCQQSV